jgi:hypothetical protein
LFAVLSLCNVLKIHKPTLYQIICFCGRKGSIRQLLESNSNGGMIMSTAAVVAKPKHVGDYPAL